MAPKNYDYEYINNKNEFKETMKCKGIHKNLLTPEMYENEAPCEVQMSGLKKKCVRLTHADEDNGVTNFSVCAFTQTRTFYKNVWNAENFVNGEWFPQNYKHNV